MPEAVIFDLDGLLIDSERVWDEARRGFVIAHGGRWHEGAQREMMGMSSLEWSRYIRHELGVKMSPEQISGEVVLRLSDLYRASLPLVPGAGEAVERLAARWPLALASSSNRELIDLVLELSEMGRRFAVTLSSEEVARGKPAPDIYIEAARRLGAEPERCVAIEDSHNGILSAAAAGMAVIAVPNREFPPGKDALEKAAATLASIGELTPEAVEAAARRADRGGR